MSYNPEALEALSPVELQKRRSEIVTRLQGLPNSYADADTETLQELAFITGALRRKNAGPPKAAKTTKRGTSGAKATAEDIASLLD